MADLSVIVTTGDGLNYTKNCLMLLLPQMGPRDELIIVDDASTDGTPEFLGTLQGLEPAVKVIARRQRQGQPAAINRGLQECTGQEILILHNDTYLLPDTVARLREIMAARPQLGAVSPMAVASRSGYTRIETRPYQTLGELSEVAREWVEGLGTWRVRWSMVLDDYCLLVRRAAIAAVRGYDIRFTPRYFAADDLSLRLWQAGWICAAAAELVVHNEGQRGINDKERAKEWYQENKRRFTEKWGFSPTYSLNVNDLLVTRLDAREPEISVLDVGCAGGGNLMRLAQVCPKAGRYGVELNAAAAKVAATFGDVTAGDITKLDRPDWEGKFSLILCGDLIEHLADPLPVVKTLGRWLKPDTGRLVVSLPNVLNYTVWQGMLQGEWTYRDNGVLDRTHLRFFTRQSGLALMEEAGLSAEVVDDNEFYITKEPPSEAMIEHILKTPGAAITRQELMALQWIIEARRPGGSDET